MDSQRSTERELSLDWRLAAVVIGAAAVFAFALFATLTAGGSWAITVLSGATLGLAVWVLIGAQRGQAAPESLVLSAPAGEEKPAPPPLPLEEMESQSWEILHHLTTVNGYCDLLRQAASGSVSEQRDDLNEIRYGGERALLGTLNLQRLMGRRKPHGQGISINPAVLDLQPRLEAVLPAGVSLQLDLDPQAGVVVHDPDLLEWLITSLVITTCHSAVMITTRAALVEVCGAGNPEMALAIRHWESLGGRFTVEGSTVTLTAPAVLAPLIAPKATL